MEQTNFLFIGGPLDGQVQAVHRPGVVFRCIKPPEPRSLSIGSGTPPLRPEPIKIIDYIYSPIAFPDSDPIGFYMLEGMTPRQAVVKLMNGYKGEK